MSCVRVFPVKRIGFVNFGINSVCIAIFKLYSNIKKIKLATANDVCQQVVTQKSKTY